MVPRWTPTEAGQWHRLVRDLIADVLAAFLVVFASLRADRLGITIVAAMFSTALALIGVPVVARLARRDDDADG